MNYTGMEVLLLAKLGGPQSYIRIDLGFGNIVDSVDYSMNLTATAKGPLFESTIHVHSYPKEFIFAEKLETVVYRGMGNTRMKDVHDLYSLISLEECLNPAYINQVVKAVFVHRQTSLDLPLRFDSEFFDIMDPLWRDYLKDISTSPKSISLPESFQEVIASINSWLVLNTDLCT